MIPQAVAMLFDALTSEMQQGNPALVECRDKHTGQSRYVICASSGAKLWPLAELHPFSLLALVDLPGGQAAPAVTH